MSKRFEYHAERTPEAIALVLDGQTLSYRELNARANQLAHRLQKLGVARDSLVALSAERSLELVVGILGIVKAGGAYVPLDPAYPRDRLEFMLEDSQAKFFVTHRTQSCTLAPSGLARVMIEDTRGEPTTNLDCEIEPTQLCYVIYTSGSTGRPKGVLVSHGNVTRLFESTRAWYGFDSSDVWTLFHSYAFDFSVWELWGALLHGGKLVVVPYWVSRSPGEFYALLSRERVTVLNQTPSAFRQLAHEVTSSQQRRELALRYVVFGGEALELQGLRAWFELVGDQRPQLVNMYGITETTVHVTYRPITLRDVEAGLGSVIGVPIPDLALQLLDDQQLPVAEGEVGEIFVAGAGLARGYLNRPELTSERFVELEGTRLYRTGDLARRLPDGELEYRGRIDQQVKIRGFRIELGEIESAIAEDPAVLGVVVIPREQRLVAYLASQSGPELIEATRARLRERLPEHMLPSAFVVLPRLPLTENGKVDRSALPEPSSARPELEVEYEEPRGPIECSIAEIWRRHLHLDRVGARDPFFDLGGTSVIAVESLLELQRALGRKVSVITLFEHPTVRGLAAALAADPLASAGTRNTQDTADEAESIAIVGMAGRFPGAGSVAELWSHLVSGRELIRFFSNGELDPAIDSSDPNYVKARGVLEDAACFDAQFFGETPSNAALIDPQQRVLLELAVAALEDAGLVPERHGRSIGVFAGTGHNSYWHKNVVPRADRVAELGELAVLLANDKDFVATRIAHKLDLTGPAVSVHTACSTSLVAVCEAVRSLLRHECDAAIAGAASVSVPQHAGHVHAAGAMLSADGHTRSFDAAASGTVFSDGGGMVVLKRRSDAERDGDRVYALIRGVATNNDGAAKASFSAPSVSGQSAVIAQAHAAAGIDPESIAYVEAHGTGTALGDPIEVEALTQAFRRGTQRSGFCALGSIKSNIGHLTAASGVAGLIKTSLCLYHRQLVPSLFYERPNPDIDFASTPFFVQTRSEPWAASGVRRAGVSSFGVGGTNAHVVLEEASPSSAVSAQRPVELLLLSAKTEDALQRSAAQLGTFLTEHPEEDLADVAYTLQTRRAHYAHRRCVVCADREQAIAELRAPASTVRRIERRDRPVAFVFPGQGAQYAGMGSALYELEPVFRSTIDRCAELLQPLLGRDVRELMGPDGDQLGQTAFAQPALFTLEYALAQLWCSWGVSPCALVGHSIGEFVAATLAGVFSEEAALSLVAQRGRLMQALPQGAMLSVRAPAESISNRLDGALALAASNGPKLCVVAGPHAAIAKLSSELERDGIANKRLDTSHAFHSPMMDPMVEPFAELVSRATLNAPRIPIVSTVTGALLSDREATDPRYWAEQLRKPVQFTAALRTLWLEPERVLLEVGPGGASATLAKQIASDRHAQVAIASLEDRPASEWSCLMQALGRAWLAGVAVDWEALQSIARRKPSALPTYPFARDRHWLEPPAAVSVRAAPPESPVMSAPASRLPQLRAELASILQSVSGSELAEHEYDTNFLELGFDSLALGQVATRVQQKFKLKIGFRQLMSDLPTCTALAVHLDAALPPAPVEQPLQPPAALPPGDGLAAIFQAQLAAMQQLIAQQNQVLAGTRGAELATAPAAPEPPRVTETSSRYRQFDPKTASQRRSIDRAQQSFIDDLSRRYVEKTPSSRSSTQQHRARLADPRAASGFRLEWKDLCYPIVSARSKGSQIWDLDGNAYIDLVNGYGQTLFGHAPDFVQAAVAEQLSQGFAIGPQSPLAGEVAALICDFVGMERVTFCNTGSEAVMAAMRVARCVTGRDKIAVFTNDYHGQFDEVLVRGKARGGEPTALPIAPGIPSASVANMLVLPYGSDESLAYLRAHMDELAAVIVEPVQSRHPELRPYEFLRALRAATEQAGTALVFDEVVTGFRVHPGGMQALCGVRADMATYGKVLGGGMPIGILAGSTRFMDALDGGSWRYGDDSFPEVAPTFFAGTFVRHPLTLAACKAVLEHLRREGPALQERLAQRTAALVEHMNADLQRKGVPTRLETFSSWFMPNFGSADPLGALFYAHARLLGIHIQDSFPCFLTTAHGEQDFERIADAFAQSIDALQSVGVLGGVAAPLPAADVVVPLTEMQQEVWMSAQLGDAASCAFNESLCVRFGGDLDLDALRGALNDVVARHDSLRTSFGTTGERLQIAGALSLAVPDEDLCAQADPEAALQARIDADARTPFDLASGPLVRAFTVRLATERRALVITAHHIVCDGWSMNVIALELAHFYAVRRNGSAATLPPASSYARHALERAAANQARPEVEAFWLEQFKTVPSLPELPADRPRPTRKTWNGATYSTRVDAELYRAVKREGARQGCTLFATLFGTFQVLMARLAEHDDVVIAVPVAGQSLLQDQVLVGHCVNFLPLRVPLDRNRSLAEHLQAVKHQLLAAFERQEYTFGTLVRKLALRRDMSRLPLTELQFNLERVGANVTFEGLDVALSPNPKAFSNFDLFFNVIESDDGLRIDCDFNTDIFERATIARWTEHFRTLLRELVSDANRPVAELPLLSPSERAWLLDELNATHLDYPSDVQLHELIARQAARTPERIAAEFTGVQLTYAELDARANRLARYLRKTVGPANGRVAVAIDRSLDMLVALLAVMKAGHTYVPLDPGHPPARLRLVLDTAEVAGLICNTAESARLAPPGAVVVRLDEAGAAIAGEDRRPLAPAQDAQCGPAYVIFTSGSTGAPKGVEVSHRALVNFMRSMARAPGFTQDDTLVAVTTISFDIAALELYLPLLCGGRVVIASREDVVGGFGLIALLKSSGASVLQATPSLWRILLEARFTPQPSLKMLCGGEALPRDLADALLATGAELWNMYGPTETTIWSSTGRVGEGPIVIGAPIANTELHVLDSRHQLQVPGAAGELYIGGDGLANGYANRPDLTDAAFRSIALDGRPARRLYRTGDLARRLADGSIQLLGRVDQQIKLRGFRIELEEIENALRAAPGVAAAAVALRPGPTGEPRLVGYVVTGTTADVSNAELVRYLSSLLPDYMIPTAWCALPELPLTPNGKLDRKALPDVSSESAAREYAPPTTPMELTLSGIWSEVLGIAQIGVRDNLFSLGADSLQIFRIAARMADRGIPLQAKHLLQHPTLAEAAGVATALVGTAPNGRAAALPSLRDFRHGARRRSQSA